MTQIHVAKEGNNVIGGIVNSRIAGKWCKRDAELEHLFALVRKRTEHIETKKQGKKYVEEICFISTLQEFNKYYYRLSKMESFLLTYSRMVISYSGYSESSVSNQWSVKETTNTNKKNHQHKFVVPLGTLLEKNCSKKFKQIIAHLVRF